MKKEWIDDAKKVAFDRFPDLEGIEPTVKTREYRVSSRLLSKLGLGGKESIRKETILTFEKEVIADDGTKLKRIVKVHIDSRGRITKFSGTK